MKIIFLGTPQIAVPSFEYLVKKDDIEVQAVITQTDKPCGRGKCISAPPIKLSALEHNIPIYQPISIRKEIELIKTLKEFEPDFFITFAFGQILSQEVLDIPKIGTINLHASLLPKYRGANPIQAPIINGEKFTGISTMLTEIGVDTGSIVLQETIQITENMTSVELAEIIAQISPELIYKSIKGLYTKTIEPTPQNHAEATHTLKVKKEDGLIDWNDSASNIHNKVRGLKPWPSTFTYINGCCIKITETRIPDQQERENLLQDFGKIIGKTGNGINVIVGDGIITVTRVQPAGKKEMDALSWFNGSRTEIGDIFSRTCGDICEAVCDIDEEQ